MDDTLYCLLGIMFATCVTLTPNKQLTLANKRSKIPTGQSKMDKLEKLATQDEEKQNIMCVCANKHK